MINSIDPVDAISSSTDILGALEAKRIIGFDIEGGSLGIMEHCDYYFRARLTKPQAQQMINELQALVDQLPEPTMQTPTPQHPPVLEQCRRCNGTGLVHLPPTALDKDPMETCKRCDGKGQLPVGSQED